MLAALIAKKKQARLDAESELCPPEILVDLLIRKHWPYEDWETLEELAAWLGPFKQLSTPDTPVPAIVHCLQLSAISSITGLRQEQVWTLIRRRV